MHYFNLFKALWIDSAFIRLKDIPSITQLKSERIILRSGWTRRTWFNVSLWSVPKTMRGCVQRVYKCLLNTYSEIDTAPCLTYINKIRAMEEGRGRRGWMEELYRRNNHENVMTWTKKQKRRNKNKDHSVSDLGD